MKKQRLDAVDMYCGAGGTSSGLLATCEANGIELNLIAINHWPIAIDTHRANHEYAKHLCTAIDDLDPRKLVPSGRLHLLVASPECTHHSNARGGKPMNDQSRSSAWQVLRWAEALYIENILVENVKEFRSWGPLGANQRPIKRLKGQIYLSFLDSLRALGYRVEDKILNAADFGDPTTRERLFIIARRGKRSIVWPTPTHAPAASLKSKQGQMFGSTVKPWRTAREIIDWSIPGKSIFDRKKPLADKTIERIAAGLRKFGGTNADPFLVLLYGTSKVRSIDAPVPTVTAGAGHIGLCEPFILGQHGERRGRSLDQPLRTITTTSRGMALIEPEAFLIGAGGPERAGKPRSVNEPMNTVLTKNSSALVEPFILNIDHQGGNGNQVRSVDDPLNTVTTKARACLVEPYLVSVNHGNKKGERNADARRAKSLSDPFPTVTASRGHGLVEPFIVKYNGTAPPASIHEPLDTVSTKERFGLLVTEHGTYRLDIRFRMLEPHELAAAQGLAGYLFTGKKTEIVKQIGNAVPKGLATALCGQLIV